MSEIPLSFLWYVVVGVAAIFYVCLDGFDLGVGILNFFTKKDEDRRIFLNAIGPVWDGNEVWLVIVGGALFAGFPEVYATLFSGFYGYCMTLLAGLIFRAVAIEFRSKRKSRRWRSTWDAVFSTSSLIIAFGLGLAIGNLMEGIPLTANETFAEQVNFFKPFPILCGFFTVSLLMMHGAIYLTLKTEGELHNRLRSWSLRCIALFIAFYVLTTIVAFFQTSHIVDKYFDNPWLFLIPVAALLSILNVPRLYTRNKDGWAFIYSCLCIFFLFCVYGFGTYPNLIRSTIDPETNSLTYLNSASSPLTMKVLLIIVLIGVPLVLAYGVFIYRVFRGKVRVSSTSY